MKAEHLAHQRPTWSVYQGKCEAAIAEGLGSHLPCNLVDCDPYGEPWPALEAFFTSDRPRPVVIAIAVNDGLRQKLRLQGGWSVRSLRQAVEKWGNAKLYERYLEVCQWKIERLGARLDYRLTHWTGYHCGDKDDMTHYGAVLELLPAARRKVERASQKKKTAKRRRK